MTEIRLLGPSDLDLLTGSDDGVFDGPVRLERAAEFLADDRHHIAVAITDGRIVGFASAVHYVHPDKEPELWIAEVGVVPDHRRSGIATRLLDALRGHARELGCTEVWVLTERANTPAMELYRRADGHESTDDVVLFSWKVS